MCHLGFVTPRILSLPLCTKPMVTSPATLTWKPTSEAHLDPVSAAALPCTTHGWNHSKLHHGSFYCRCHTCTLHTGTGGCVSAFLAILLLLRWSTGHSSWAMPKQGHLLQDLILSLSLPPFTRASTKPTDKSIIPPSFKTTAVKHQ